MKNVVAILENVGASPVLRHSGNGELQEALELASVAPQVQAAILANDRSKLEAITGCRVIAHKVVTPGRDDEDEGEDDAPKRDDDEIRAALADAFAHA